MSATRQPRQVFQIRGSAIRPGDIIKALSAAPNGWHLIHVEHLLDSLTFTFTGKQEVI